MTAKMFSLCDIVANLPVLSVIDVGAMMLEGKFSCCGPLVERGMARMIGFEPNEAECAKLRAAIGAPHRFFPHFVGDGRRRIFHETNWAPTGSLYAPNRAVLDRFQNLGEGVQLVATHEVQTVRLDDVAEIDDADFLKIDVQGAECDVLAGATRLLDKVVVIQVEVEFAELYAGQPLFADVDILLRRHGFLFHTFAGFAGRTLKPMVVGGDLNRPVRQMLWSDAIYIRDAWQGQKVPPEKLLKMALVMHDEFGSFDVCYAILQTIDRAFGSQSAPLYAQQLARATGGQITIQG